MQPSVAKPFGSRSIVPYFARNNRRRERDISNSQNHPNLTNSRRYAIISTVKRYFSRRLISASRTSKTRGCKPSRRLAPCSQLVAKTKKTPFYGPLTSGFAVHCVYSGLPISHENRPNVPKPTRKNNFRRVQLPSAPT